MVHILEVTDLKRSFRQGHKTIEVLRGINLSVDAGELVGLVGASGSGKSTLLQIAGLLDKSSAGNVVIGSTETTNAKDEARSVIRREQLGFIYQFHHLLPEFTALENVALAARISGANERDANSKASDLLAELKLSDRLDHIPAKLSGGEQQRVAIARALAGDPKLVLADEPTGNLDEATAVRVFDLLVETVKSRGVAALIATHDMALAEKMDRQFVLKEGQLFPK